MDRAPDIPGFRILRPIGSGGMGDVFLAKQDSLGRSVAIKVLRPIQGTDLESQQTRFQREARILGQLSHQHVVAVFDQGMVDASPYLVMEFLDGGSLRRKFPKEGLLPVSESRRLLRAIADAVIYLHSQHILYRDLKPENILLGSEGEVKLGDFGIAVSKAEIGELTGTSVLGTESYLAPEQRYHLPVDERADQYSLAFVAYEMLTGRLPLGVLKPPSARSVQLTEDVDRVLLRGLQEEPEDRFASVEEFARELDAALAAIPEPASSPNPTFGNYENPGAADTASSPQNLTDTTRSDTSTGEVLVPPRSRFQRILPWLVAVIAIAVVADVLLELRRENSVAPPNPGNDVAKVAKNKPQANVPAPANKPANKPTAPSPAAKTAPPEAEKPKEGKAPYHFTQYRWRKHLDIPVEKKNSIGMTMILIPPGVFQMGSEDSDKERLLKMLPPIDAQQQQKRDQYVVSETPKHSVRISQPFYLGAHEVTRGQFRQFVERTGFTSEALSKGKNTDALTPMAWWVKSKQLTDDCPATNVNWHEAQAFCEWLSKKEGKTYALPTEAEWEYACRANSSDEFYWGNKWHDFKDHAWVGDVKGTLKPVGLLQPNAYGLYDMIGNAFEWTADRYSPNYYSKSPNTDPKGPSSGEERSVRGGATNTFMSRTRPASRYSTPPSGRWNLHGFRVKEVIPRGDSKTEQ
ncbi:bifunctional serine/threonine-protein kinase/formylglycine-generating enzyme family protein [Planctomycetes bacterium Pan216]